MKTIVLSMLGITASLLFSHMLWADNGNTLLDEMSQAQKKMIAGLELSGYQTERVKELNRQFVDEIILLDKWKVKKAEKLEVFKREWASYSGDMEYVLTRSQYRDFLKQKDKLQKRLRKFLKEKHD